MYWTLKPRHIITAIAIIIVVIVPGGVLTKGVVVCASWGPSQYYNEVLKVPMAQLGIFTSAPMLVGILSKTMIAGAHPPRSPVTPTPPAHNTN